MTTLNGIKVAVYIHDEYVMLITPRGRTYYITLDLYEELREGNLIMNSHECYVE